MCYADDMQVAPDPGSSTRGLIAWLGFSLAIVLVVIAVFGGPPDAAVDADELPNVECLR